MGFLCSGHSSVSSVAGELAAWLQTIPQVLAKTYGDGLAGLLAKRMAQFVSNRKFEKLGHRAPPFPHQLSGALRIVDEERLFEKCFPRFQSCESRAVGIQAQHAGNRLPVLGANQNPCPRPQRLDRVACEDTFQLKDILLTLWQRIARMTMEFLARQCRWALHSSGCNFRSGLTHDWEDPNHQAATHNQSRRQELHGSTSSAVADGQILAGLELELHGGRLISI